MDELLAYDDTCRVIGTSAIAVRSARIGVLARVLYGTRLELEGMQGAVGKLSLSRA